MLQIIFSFFTSFILTLVLIKFQHLHRNYTADSDFSSPQKVHIHPVPRIGGLSIFVAVFLCSIIGILKGDNDLYEQLTIILCAAPIFGIGFIEDITQKVSVRKRLLITFCACSIAGYLLNLNIASLLAPNTHLFILLPIIGILLAAFSITGVTNAYNIIDGFNGLSSMVAIISLLGIAYLAITYNDRLVLNQCLFMIAAILGFFLWNYPLGLIFLGDCGAYLIGYWVAILSTLLVIRHNQISPWFALLLNGYPIIETLFTIYRRKFNKRSYLTLPDRLHFHTLFFRRVIQIHFNAKELIYTNAMTSPYMWIFASLGILPAVVFSKSTSLLITAFVLLVAFYIFIYKIIIKFNCKKWFIYILISR